MADVNRGNRPLSPFMIGQYYRPQMTSISSIMVRITGIASLGTALLIVLWLLTAATSPSAFANVDGFLRSFVGDILMLLATWAI
ncbi:succinate dehydrogenase, cytochrome b556 subunit, partial [Cribrihabitans sp. XS_ASV171]